MFVGGRDKDQNSNHMYDDKLRCKHERLKTPSRDIIVGIIVLSPVVR